MRRPAAVVLWSVTASVLALTTACARGGDGGKTAPAPAAAPAAVPVASALPRWLEGSWESDGTRQHWVAAGDALFGVAFLGDGGWGVGILAADAKGRLGLTLWHAGTDAMRFAAEDGEAAKLALVGEGAAQGSSLALHRDGAALMMTMLSPVDSSSHAFSPAGFDAAPELVQADRDFAAETAAKGGAGWAAWFAPDGVMGRPTKRIVGRAAVEATMTPIFASGARLAWGATHSAWGPARTRGFTVGEAVFTAADGTTSRSAYVTLWSRQADGRYLVEFDAGDDY